MEMNSSIKNGLFTAIVMGASTTAAYAAAELGDAQVVQADPNGFEATVSLKNQPAEDIGTIDLTRNVAAVNANAQASSKLIVSFERAIDGTDSNHLIRVKGPGEVTSENLAFNVQVSKLDGSKLIKGYEVLPSMAANTAVKTDLGNAVARGDSADVLAVMSEYEEVPGVTVLPMATEAFPAEKLAKNKKEKAPAPPAVEGVVAFQTPTIQMPETAVTSSIASESIKIGQVTARSSMGERLALEFDVFGEGIGSVDNLKVQVSPDTSLGALAPDSASVVAMMEQKIEKRGTGRYVVSLTSDQVMNEPLIPLLIDVKSGGQTESLNYSVFMDPPQAGSPAFESLPTLHADAGNFILVDKPVKATEGRAAAAITGRAKYGKSTSKYTVSEGETLASIAANLKGKVPLNEKMRHLRDNNPQAFINGDMNRVIAGSSLNVPASWRKIRNEAVIVAKKEATSPVEQTSPVEALAQQKQEETLAATQKTDGVEILAQGQSNGGLELPDVEDQLIGDEALVTEVKTETPPPVVAKTSDQAGGQNNQVAAAVVEEGSLLDNTDVLALAGGAAAVAMATGGVILLRRRRANAVSEFSLEDGTQLESEEDFFFTETASLLNSDVSLDRIDYIAESDALMARGQLDQAILVLQTGVLESSDHTNVLFRLFELLATKGDSANFNQTAIKHAAVLRSEKNLLARVNKLAQKMDTVPEVFRSVNLRKTDENDLQGQAVI